MADHRVPGRRAFAATLACLLLATLLAATTTPARAAGPAVWACLSLAPGQETTLRLPSEAVDELVAHTRSYRGPCAEYGASAPLGDGTLTAYSQRVGGRPVAVGLIMTDDVLDGLPQSPPNDGTLCFDKDGDGSIDPMTECSGGYGRQLDLSPRFRRHVDTPLTYVLANWNPMGHIPVGVYDVPHFDVHFYLNPNSERLAIRTGPCPALVNCDDYVLGKRLPDARYLAPDYVDLDAVEPAMGNHLIDQTAPEFHGQPFTHTWIYGTWDGETTFYEAMVTRAWYAGLRDGGTADACFPFKLPQEWQRSGWYPTTYCLRHRANRGELVTSLEDFVYRTAS